MFPIILAIVAFLLALVCMAMGVIAIIGSARQNRQCSKKVSGLVTRILVTERKVKNGTVKAYTPVYSYNVGGKTFEGKATFAMLKKEFKEGQAITVRYDPKDPGVSFLPDASQNSGNGGITMLVIGLLFLVGGLALIL